MKNRKILFGTLGVAVMASSLFLLPANNDTEAGLYSSRVKKNSADAELISGAFDYYRLIRTNVVTGEVSAEDYQRAKAEVGLMVNSGNRSGLEFKNHGPDNVGGRTRAILIDKNDYKHIYAGSVSGGLFESFNRGNTWKKVEGYDANFGISSMCQTDDGTIYVGTGHSEEGFNGSTQSTGFNGNGVYYSNDNGATFEHIDGSEDNTFVNEVVAKGNSVLIAGSEGLTEYDNGTLTDFTTISGVCKAVAISNDYQVIIGSFSTQRTWVSTDGGATFTDVYGNGATEIPGGKSRVEYAISHERIAGDYHIYASMSAGNGGSLHGVYRSIDNGLTWEEIAPENNGSPGSFAPFDAGGQSQGNYDQIMTVVPGDHETCLLGGIAIHGKSVTGNWETRSSRLVPQTNPLYVHSDQHEMQWDSQGRLWIGNDGGVFYSDDAGHTFREANRGYNVTQFYRIAASAHGDVMGGTQDNGTQANYHDNHTYREHDQVNGGDGYACDFSFMNRDVIFSSIYYGAFYRSGDRGLNTTQIIPQNIPASFGTPGGLTNGLGSFFTVIELYENPNDIASQDTVVYAVSESLPQGTEIQVPSATSQQFMSHVLTEDVTFQDSLYANAALTIEDTTIVDTTGTNVSFNLYYEDFTYVFGSAPISIGDSLMINGEVYGVDSMQIQNHYFGTNPGEPGEVVDMGFYDFLENIPWDTVRVQDVYQSWLAFGLGSGDGLWLSRNSLRFSALHDGFLQAGGNISGQVTEMEFSKDGNYLFVGTSNGSFYRLGNLNSVYTPNPTLGTGAGNVPDTLITWNGDDPDPTYTTETTFELINNFSGPVTGINVEKGDPDHVMVTLGGFGVNGRVQESTDATTGANFSSIHGNLPNMPCLSIVMDRNDPNIVFVGTEFGLWRSEAGGTNWEFCDGPFGQTPIFDLKQNWRTWNEGCHKPGQIYIGTHGRGIWTTDEYLSLPELQDNTGITAAISDLLLFPNPVIDNATIAFNVKEAGQAALRVYSLTGKLVQENNNVNLVEGENKIALAADELAPGTYIVNLSTGKDSKTTKFIKQ